MNKAIILVLCALAVGCTNPTAKEKKMYRVKVVTSPGETGTISPSPDSLYEEGQTITLHATPSEGYIFSSWSGDLSASENPHTFTIDRDYSLKANFMGRSYELTVGTEGEGTIMEEVVEQKSKEYEHGTVVRLTAEPADGYRFAGWEGHINSTENPVEVVVDEPVEVTAIFERRGYPLDISVEGDGTVSEEVIQSRSKDYDAGTVVELKAEPAEGYRFIEWRGDVRSSENPIQIVIDEAKEVTAVFGEEEYDLDIHVMGEGSVDQETVASKSDSYASVTQVQLTAIPDDGWEFSRWEGDVHPGNRKKNPIVVQVDSDKNITAVFKRKLKGTVSEKRTLYRSDGPYSLSGKVQIAEHASLVLERGVKISGQSSASDESNTIEVFGKLEIKGTRDDKVVLENVIIKPGSNSDDDWDDFDDDDWDDDDHRGDLYEIEIEHAVLIGGKLLPPTGAPSYGSLKLKDSFLFKVNRSRDNSSFLFLSYPQKKSTIERNIFYNSGRVAVASHREEVEVKNNYFYRDEYLSRRIGYAVEHWSGSGKGKIVMRNNTFANTRGIAVNLSENTSSRQLDAKNNYWSTTSDEAIEQMIYDGRDDRNIDEEVRYSPYRSSPDNSTPTLPDSLR